MLGSPAPLPRRDTGRSMSDPVLFGLAVVAILATPGPTNTLLATSGAAGGLRRSLPLVPAELAGYLIAIATIGFLVAPIVSDIPALTTMLQLSVAAYLAFLAARLWRRGTAAFVGRRIVAPSDVFVTTLLNPKALIFATGVIPLHQPGSTGYVAAFCAAVVCISVAWIAVGAAIGRGAQLGLASSIVPRIGAAAICIFAALLMVKALD